MNFSPRNQNSQNRGFSLLEVIVSLTVFMTAMIGIFGLLSYNIVNAALLRNRLIAANLAQEGIEVVRNIRDANFLLQETAPSTPWDQYLTNDGDWQIAYNSQMPSPLSGAPLNFHQSSGLYDYASVPGDTVASIFFRRINITHVNDQEIKVEAVMTWKERGKDMPPLLVEDHLFDWK